MIDTNEPPVRGIGLAGATNLALLAPVRDGLAPGFEPVSYLERLRRLLDAMHASRRNGRESELREAFFPDPIGRFGIISGFRYALVPPTRVASSRWHLSLNVTFDGGWEPYMRVIYRDIGALLDALLCHCDGYPGSRTSDFDTYCRWVRSAELDAGIFYTDGHATLADQRYLARVERLQREGTRPDPTDAAIATHHEPDIATARREGLARALADPDTHLALPLRALKGLFRLTSFWSGADGDILLRFARLVLADFQDLLKAPGFVGTQAETWMRRLFRDELQWFEQACAVPDPRHRADWNEALLQGPLHADAPSATHGALLLLRVTDGPLAAAHLAALAPRCAAPATARGEARLQVGFTFAGLRALGVHEQRLARVPAEFRDGMERRAGLLGDLRANHPDHWRRPLRHGVDPAREDRIDLAAVHVAVMLRTTDAAAGGPALHPLLAAEVDAFARAGSGLAVLAVEPTRSRSAEPDGRDHFGFVDGISQPRVVAGRPPDPRRMEVRPGELVLGFETDRGDAPIPVDELLDRGSFLVVRKLRQRLDRLRDALARAAGVDPAAQQELLERMVGRRMNGDALVATGPLGRNDFDFEQPDGARCPFASHVRRTNPRSDLAEGHPPIPRILRRGMSYGPSVGEAALDADRGTLFMACCASIAEQFETMQRWVAGGNSSGVASTHADPLLGVPREGVPTVFRWVGSDDKAYRADLGEQAFVELQWGLYLFTPALPALEQLAAFRLAPPASLPPGPTPLSGLDRWRADLEDRVAGRATWADVRTTYGGVRDAPPYGRLVGSAAGVFAALGDAAAATVSVQGFGERMQDSLGLNHLGMDPADGHTAVGAIVNPEVARIGEAEAFATAQRVAGGVLGAIVQAAASPRVPRHPDGRLRVPLDLMGFADRVVAELARLWFGLPDGERMQAGGRIPMPDPAGAPRCPGHLIGPSRMIFGAHPRTHVESEGALHGPVVKKAVEDVLAAGLPAGTGLVTERLRAPLAAQGGAHGSQLLEREVAGLLLGFAPTVHGNFLTVMRNWIDGEQLGVLQQALADGLLAGQAPFDAAKQALRRPLLDAMQHEPVPPMVWRRAVVDGKPDAKALPVVLGLASAIASDELAADEAARDALLFGGTYSPDPATPHWGLHACPGARMGVGVMLAMATTLLAAGTLRPTGSPVLLMLTPKSP